MVFYQVIIPFTFCGLIIKYAATNASRLEVTACYNNSSSLEMITNKPKVVDVVNGSIVHLWCHFCEVKEDYYPKLWYYKPRENKKQNEILSEVTNDDFGTEIRITPVHTLNIPDFKENNSGIYTCESPEIMEKRNRFTYILEGVLPGLKFLKEQLERHNSFVPGVSLLLFILTGVIDVQIGPKVGTSIHWQDYKRNYFDTLNKKFKTSEEEPFKSFRRDLNKTFKLTTIWENWGECKEIGRQKGVRKRIGRCRLQPNVIDTTLEKMPMVVIVNIDAMSYLTDGYDISCRSLQLNKTVPKISEIVRNIPDFEAEETCHIVERVKYKINKDKRKHKTIKKVEEYSHVTLSCTEAVPNSDLKWFRDTKLLNSLLRNNIRYKNEEEPHISIDTNNSLHILHISKNEEGNYSCLSNGKKVQEFEVIVVSKAKLLNQEFIRYSIYLGFVLSLAMTCYCAGVCVAWHRRSSFVDPLNVNKKGNHVYCRLQCEREKLLK